MAAGPILPFSQDAGGSARLFPYRYVSAGANYKRLHGLGVEASLGGDAYWELAFALPKSLPSGTLKLRLLAQANAAAGNAKVNPKWASVAAAEDPGSLTLNAEGTSTLTWSTGDADKLKELVITLDADTAVAGEILVMQLCFETASWTLAAASSWLPFLIWE